MRAHIANKYKGRERDADAAADIKRDKTQSLIKTKTNIGSRANHAHFKDRTFEISVPSKLPISAYFWFWKTTYALTSTIKQNRRNAQWRHATAAEPKKAVLYTENVSSSALYMHACVYVCTYIKCETHIHTYRCLFLGAPKSLCTTIDFFGVVFRVFQVTEKIEKYDVLHRELFELKLLWLSKNWAIKRRRWRWRQRRKNGRKGKRVLVVKEEERRRAKKGYKGEPGNSSFFPFQARKRLKNFWNEEINKHETTTTTTISKRQQRRRPKMEEERMKWKKGKLSTTSETKEEEDEMRRTHRIKSTVGRTHTRIHIDKGRVSGKEREGERERTDNHMRCVRKWTKKVLEATGQKTDACRREYNMCVCSVHMMHMKAYHDLCAYTYEQYIHAHTHPWTCTHICAQNTMFKTLPHIKHMDDDRVHTFTCTQTHTQCAYQYTTLIHYITAAFFAHKKNFSRINFSSSSSSSSFFSPSSSSFSSLCMEQRINKKTSSVREMMSKNLCVCARVCA